MACSGAVPDWAGSGETSGFCAVSVPAVSVTSGVRSVSVGGGVSSGFASGFFAVSTSCSTRYPQRRIRERIIRWRNFRRLVI